MSVRYDSATFGQPNVHLLESEVDDAVESQKETMSFKPTTPIFFSQLALANGSRDFIIACLVCGDPLKIIVSSDKPPMLKKLLTSGARPAMSTPHLQSSFLSNLLCNFRWTVIRLLRGLHLSELDGHARNSADHVLSIQYQKDTLLLLVAKRFAFGSVEIVNFVVWCVQALVLWQGLEVLSMLLNGISFTPGHG